MNARLLERHQYFSETPLDGYTKSRIQKFDKKPDVSVGENSIISETEATDKNKNKKQNHNMNW